MINALFMNLFFEIDLLMFILTVTLPVSYKHRLII